jgi:hypothetical protein
MRTLFDSPDVTKALLVDQHFGKEALGLLARVGHVSRIEILTRISDSDFDDLRALLLAKPGLVAPPLTILRCNRAFHDRFLVVQKTSSRELYVLSNSFAPLASAHPIVIQLVVGRAALEIFAAHR